MSDNIIVITTYFSIVAKIVKSVATNSCKILPYGKFRYFCKIVALSHANSRVKCRFCKMSNTFKLNFLRAIKAKPFV